MLTAERYRRKAEECVALAKTAVLNQERARQYALAEHYTRLAMEALISTEQRHKPAPSLSGRSSALGASRSKSQNREHAEGTVEAAPAR
jgi:hypothetical protein